METSSQRIKRELKNLMEDPVELISVEPDGQDINFWNIIITGPPETPYAGGIFKLKAVFGGVFPDAPPKVLFETKIYHPNINSRGDICLDILKPASSNNRNQIGWTKDVNMRQVLLGIYALLINPNPDDALVPEIGNLYKSNITEFNTMARDWTNRHAN